MKILVFADCPGWVFERHYNELKKRLTEHELDVVFLWNEVPNNISRYAGYDLFYMMDPIPVAFLPTPVDRTIIGLRNEFMYQHTPRAIQSFFNSSIRSKARFFHVVNRRQYEEFKPIANIPLFLTQHGVDTDCFAFDPSMRKRIDSEFVVGTSGCATSDGKKGFGTVEKVCMENGWKLVTAKQNLGGKQLKKENMPDFYRGIDVYVCFSESEGLNNCIMEAGAMGVPIISTDTGAAREMVNKNECGFVIQRTEHDLREKIGFMNMYRQHAQSMGDNMRSAICRNWSWDAKIQGFRTMFSSCFDSVGKRES